MRRCGLFAALVAALAAAAPPVEAAHAANWFAQWRAWCDNTFLRSRFTPGVSVQERVYKVTRDCIEAAERDGFPYQDLIRGYATARGQAEFEVVIDPAKGEAALADLEARVELALSEVARREQGDQANWLRAVEIFRQAQEAEQRRQEMQELREEVGAAKEAAEAAREEAERTRRLQEQRQRLGVNCWQVGNMIHCR